LYIQLNLYLSIFTFLAELIILILSLQELFFSNGSIKTWRAP